MAKVQLKLVKDMAWQQSLRERLTIHHCKVRPEAALVLTKIIDQHFLAESKERKSLGCRWPSYADNSKEKSLIFQLAGFFTPSVLEVLTREPLVLDAALSGEHPLFVVEMMAYWLALRNFSVEKVCFYAHFIHHIDAIHPKWEWRQHVLCELPSFSRLSDVDSKLRQDVNKSMLKASLALIALPTELAADILYDAFPGKFTLQANVDNYKEFLEELFGYVAEYASLYARAKRLHAKSLNPGKIPRFHLASPYKESLEALKAQVIRLGDSLLPKETYAVTLFKMKREGFQKHRAPTLVMEVPEPLASGDLQL